MVRLADGVASRLRAARHAARTVQLKVRFGDFRTITRSRTLPEPTDLAADIAGVARELLRALDVAGGVRLLGVSAQQLVRLTPEPGDQGQLFAADPALPGPPPDGDGAAPGGVGAVGRRGAGPIRARRRRSWKGE